MTLEYLKNAINEGNEIFFDYNGKRCSVLIKVENGIFTFTVVYGEDEIVCSDFNEVINAKFFGGKSIIELLDIVEFDFY